MKTGSWPLPRDPEFSTINFDWTHHRSMGVEVWRIADRYTESTLMWSNFKGRAASRPHIPPKLTSRYGLRLDRFDYWSKQAIRVGAERGKTAYQ